MPTIMPSDASLALAEDAPALWLTLGPDAAALTLSPNVIQRWEFTPDSSSLSLLIDGASVGSAGSAVDVLSTPSVILYEVDCIEPSPGQTVLTFSRVDPAQLPREIEIQYIDRIQNYAAISQTARHHQSRIKNGTTEAHASTTATLKSSLGLDFIITASEARTLAFGLLYRAWTEAVSFEFTHPNLAIEAGDTFQLIGRFGSLIGRVDEQVWTKQRTNQIKATLLAPPGPVMAADDSAITFGDGAVGQAYVGVAIWGGVPGLPKQAHITLKKKKSTATPAVQFGAGSD